jgi:hypothetical protein
MRDFQLGDRVELVETEFQGMIIAKSYGDVRYEVRCDDGLHLRDLVPEALRLLEESVSSAARKHLSRR